MLAGQIKRQETPLTRKLASCLTILAVTSTMVWLSTGCTTGVVIKNQQNTSLNLLQFVINQQIPRGVRTKSANQREFFSNYFSPEDGFDQDATTQRERAYAHVLILGATRPYRTEVRVYREQKTSSGYRRSGLDKNLSRLVSARIREGLAKSREERNVIDDFRPF